MGGSSSETKASDSPSKMGGGFRDLIPGRRNADVIAAAIVASAAAYGDDPERAVTSVVAVHSRCLAPAMAALAERRGDAARIAGWLGRPYDLLSKARWRCADHPSRERSFDAAELAARVALTALGRVDTDDDSQDDEAEVATPASIAPIVPAPIEPVGRHAEVATPSVTAKAGAISSTLRPAFMPHNEPPAPVGALRARIVKALKDGAHTASGMASRLGEKEAVVEQTLIALRYEAKVQSDPSEGRTRGTLWSLPRSGSEPRRAEAPA